MAILYLHPGLATGSNNGSDPDNAFQSWAALATEVNANYNNLVSAAEGLTVKVLGSSIALTAAGPTFAVESNATYPLVFEVDAENRSPAVWSATAPGFDYPTNFAYTFMTFNERVASAPLHVEFRGMQFYGRYRDVIFNVSATLVVDSCYIRYLAGGASAAGVFYRGSEPITATFKNNVIAGLENTGTGTKGALYAVHASTVVDFHNNTVVNLLATSGPMTAVSALAASTVRAVNNLCVNAVIAPEANLDVSAYNATDAATGLGSNNITYSITTAGLFASASDYHLSAANTWGVGPSDGTYGSYVPTTDIDGDTRSGATADAGADEFATAPAPTPPYVSVSIS